MAGVAYADVIEVLLNRFPEFVETEHYDLANADLAYIVWAGFGSYVTDHLRGLPAERLDDDPFVARVFDLANELMDSDDTETRTIVVVELFENFYAHWKTLELARRKLKTEHLPSLEGLSTSFRTLD